MFPEYGISGRLIGREHASYYTEMIPDPISHTSFCPCAEDKPAPGQEVLYRLSCIAAKNAIYVAANMADRQPCLRAKDLDCPISSHYQYNTEVVFNKTGCLVAKYHKQHLFLGEKLKFDTPKAVEHSYFDTDFGRFGLMTCFDAVYKSPAVELVTDYNVTDVIFSTAWMNVFPHFVSVAYHSGWARTLRVNYLSSNLHYVSSRFVGSGIFSPSGVIAYTYNLTSPMGQLVVAKVPINKRHRIDGLPKIEISSTGLDDSYSFKSKVFGDHYHFVPLTGLAGNRSVCYGSVCCYLEFSRSYSEDYYALGAFNDMHYLEGTYYLEVCILMQCAGPKDCSNNHALPSVTNFISYNLTGIMNTMHAYPEVITPDFNFTSNWKFSDSGFVKSISASDSKISSVVLMGRNFDKDPISETTANLGNACYLMLPLLIIAYIV